ncbi:MAG: NUDIX domain-containing protein [Saprospiraceae bacterium]|jgi:8-oxo-dGTP diphosphatase|nr:NUDIX domain-containing protein [Saprospiraceae bacterium]
MEGLKRAAVFCILHCEDSFLLLKRGKNPNKSKFVPPGGKIESYESPYDAMLREVKEETGLDLTEVKFCGVLSETSPTSYNWISFIYTATIPRVEKIVCDEGEFYWIPKSEVLNTDIPTADKYIYQFVANQQAFFLNAIYDKNLIMTEISDELSGDILFKNEGLSTGVLVSVE